jgi:hypothetical protein
MTWRAKILACGDRNYYNYKYVQVKLDEIAQTYFYGEKIVLIEGGAKGADTLARLAAERLGWAIVTVPAQWDKLGKAAGPVRNKAMLDMEPDIIVAFHDNIRESKGTYDMMCQGNTMGVPVFLFGNKA